MELYLKDKGYKSSGILSIEVKYSFINQVLSYNEWSIKIVYKDEPKARYFYICENGKIYPNGISGNLEGNIYKHGDPEPLKK